MSRMIRILVIAAIVFAALFFLQGRVGERPQIHVEKEVNSNAL